ncbi:MAG: tetratricopeptide repeat protein [Ruminiclostridium sp.]|nr:tetratricopeptide repeat protein [Ruminiclostridium sp.]
MSLSQMQLMVIPITTRFLSERNRARDLELPYALAQHIPVLPLMQEANLDALFEQICGDLQFLTKENPDNTAIPYEKKLGQFLSSVLIGDELAAKVRGAFDAYIFLSYRKKDRKYAQELMKLIHSQEFCRDIAIWYDEFLVPGEHFNAAIRQALEQCELFALAVTPHLLEEPNYVKDHEYPLARQENKTILPAEILPTDKDQLASAYEGLPACTNARNSLALSDALVATLQGLALRQNDGDPQHNFFIGLAYLSGIDVEVDHTRAVTLITSAAEDGLPEAIKKLANMYQRGEGVMKDTGAAIHWLRALVDTRQREYDANPTSDPGWALFSSLFDLGELYYEQKLLSEAERAFLWAKELAGELLEKAPNNAITSQNIAVCCTRLGHVYQDLGQQEDAEACYLQSQKISIALLENRDSPKHRSTLSVSCIVLGNFYSETGRFQEAREQYMLGRELCTQLLQESGSISARENLSMCNKALALLCKKTGRYQEAEVHYTHDLELWAPLAAATETVYARQNLSASLYHLALACKTNGNLTEAEAHSKRRLSLETQLAEETGTFHARRNLSIAQADLGDIYRSRQQFDLAESCYKQSLALCEQLAKESNTTSARIDLQSRYARMADLCRDIGQLRQADAYEEKSALISKQIDEEEHPDTVLWNMFLKCYQLGQVSMANGQLETAESYYQIGLTITQQLAEKQGTPNARRNLSISYADLGDVYQAKGQMEQAEDYYQKSLSICEELVKATDTKQTRSDLADRHRRLSNHYRGWGRIERADLHDKLSKETLTRKTGQAKQGE